MRLSSLLLISVLFFSVRTVNAQSEEGKINWLTWEEAYAKQQKEPRKIFIDIYTDWCGWCKKMDQSTFQDPIVVNTLNEMYYPVKFDAERKDTINFNDHEFVNPKPNARRSAHTFAVTLLEGQMSYPSYTILDENFNRIHIIKGFKRVPALSGVLLFFGSNEHMGYLQYMNQQQKRQQKQQQTQNK